MNKKRRLIFFISIICLIATVFCLTACNGGGNGGGGDDSGGGGDITPPVVEDPVLKPMNNYFSGARVSFEKNTLQNENGVQTQFTNLLDRQFSVLAEDILYRLQLVYGEGTYGTTSTFQDLALNGGNYSLNGNSAKVLKDNLFMNNEHLGQHDEVHNKTYQNIDCLKCYQDIISTADPSLDMNKVDTLVFQGAKLGRYTTINLRNNELQSEINIDKQWRITDLQNENALNEIIMSVAKIVAGDADYLTASYNEVSYKNVLKNINQLCFENKVNEKVVNLINNKVIGSNLIEENLNIYNSFTTEEKHTIIRTLDNNKKLFKGYNIVVPAIVEKALNNTFENTTTSIYPTVSKNASEVYNFTNLTTPNAYKEVYLMPSNSSVKPTKIEVEVSGDAASEGKTIGIYVTIRNAAGTVKGRTKVADVTLSTTAQKIVVTMNTETIGKFTGNGTANYGATSLFGTSTALPNENLLYGVNYIKFDFDNANNATFGLNFNGMYNK